MAANVRYPNVSWENLPASMSPKLVSNFLKTALGFKGIIVSDSLIRKGITDNYSLEDAAEKCMRAGVDLILADGNFDDQERIFQGILKGVRNRVFTEERLDESLRKILRIRHRRPSPIPCSEDASSTMMKIARDSITLLRNENNVLPIKPAEEEYIGIFNPVFPEEDIPTISEFFTAKHPWVEEIQYQAPDEDLNWEEIAERIAPCKWIIFATCSRGPLPSNVVWWVRKIMALEKPFLVIALCSPYNIMQIPEVPAYLATYGYRSPSLEAAVEVVLGENTPRGRLPVAIPEIFKSGDGLLQWSAA
jgi:beta-N-acetylhexosaminidase